MWKSKKRGRIWEKGSRQERLSDSFKGNYKEK
jgi:hypothetical protein